MTHFELAVLCLLALIVVLGIANLVAELRHGATMGDGLTKRQRFGIRVAHLAVDHAEQPGKKGADKLRDALAVHERLAPGITAVERRVFIESALKQQKRTIPKETP